MHFPLVTLIPTVLHEAFLIVLAEQERVRPRACVLTPLAQDTNGIRTIIHSITPPA